MLFNSVKFLCFFAVGGILYYSIPKRFQWILLLLLSLAFYLSAGFAPALFLLCNILITYICALLLYQVLKPTYRKIILAGTLLISIGTLAYLKYYNFFANTCDTLLTAANSSVLFPAQDLVLPLGISFYTLQSAGYCIDVYRKKYPPERNPAKFGLFLLFFPAISQGPIGRYDLLAPQFSKPHVFEEQNLVSGFQLMLWGYFKKVVVADRAAVLVNQVFDHYADYHGFELFVAAVFYSVQLYADFSGYMDIASGVSEFFGIRISQNFNRPYFAKSIQDFWRRWHMTLSFWLRDYLYIPLGGNRKGKVRKYCNVILVFLVSGFWHGVGFHYIAWGLLHGLEQVIGGMLMPLRKRYFQFTHISSARFSHRAFQIIFTFSLVTFDWIFFRSSGLLPALRFIKSMVSVWNPWIFFDGTLYTLGLNAQNFWLVILSSGIMLFVSLFQRQHQLRVLLRRQGPLFRWGISVAGICAVLLLGAYGTGYNAADFIYMQF